MSAQQNDEPIVPIAWYKPSQWERLEEIAPDIKQACQSYEDWHAAITRAMNRLRRQGRRAEKVEVDVEELLAWCQAQDRPVDSAARAEYAAARLAEKFGS